jgi:hypothetical protein
MFERGKNAKRLWARAAMCEEVAHLHAEDVMAHHLERLAQHCRDVAFIVLREGRQSKSIKEQADWPYLLTS